MDLGIKGKRALVTGGTHGIGLATALCLAKEGCDVAICGRDLSRLVEAKKHIIQHNSGCIGIQADVTLESGIGKITDTIINQWGSIHILINNVGGGGRWGSDNIEDTDESVWSDVYDKNVTSARRLTMAFLPAMLKQKWGRILTVSSTCGRHGVGRPWFNIAKASQIVLMKNLAMKKEYVRKGVTFNSIAPGAIMIPDTGWHEKSQLNPQEFKRMVDEQFTLGRLGTPNEVASVIVFMCSEKASYINGACILADGGETSCF